MGNVFRTQKRPGARRLPGVHAKPALEWNENLEAQAVARRLANKPVLLAPDEPMFFGMHKRMPVDRMCRLHPAYVHYLIREGVVKATREICGLIQEGYDAEARRLSQEYGPVGSGRDWKWTPVKPKEAPKPVD